MAYEKFEEPLRKQKYRHVSSDNLRRKFQSFKNRRHRRIRETFLTPLNTPFDKFMFNNSNNFDMCHGEPALNNINNVPKTKMFVDFKNCKGCNSNSSFFGNYTFTGAQFAEPLNVGQKFNFNARNISFEANQWFSSLNSLKFQTKAISSDNSFLPPRSRNSSLRPSNLSIWEPKQSSKEPQLSYYYNDCHKTTTDGSLIKGTYVVDQTNLNKNGSFSETCIKFQSSKKSFSNQTLSSINKRMSDPNNLFIHTFDKLEQDSIEDSSHIITDDETDPENVSSRHIRTVSSPEPKINNENLFSDASVPSEYFLRSALCQKNVSTYFKETQAVVETSQKDFKNCKQIKSINCCNQEQTSKVNENANKFSDEFLLNMMSFLQNTTGIKQANQTKLLQDSRNTETSKAVQDNILEAPNLMSIPQENGKSLQRSSSKILKARIQETKQNTPDTSTIQIVLEINRSESHNVDIFTKTPKNKRSLNKIKRSVPRFKTARKISSDVQRDIKDFKFSEGILGSNIIREDRCKQLGTECSSKNDSNSNSSLRSNQTTLSGTDREAQFKFARNRLDLDYSRRRMYSSDLLSVNTNFEFRNSLRNIEKNINTIENRFVDLEYRINNLKKDVTRLIYKHNLASKFETPLVRNFVNDELHRNAPVMKCTSCDELNKNLSVAQACLGGGLALSVIFIMWSVYDDIIHNGFN